MSVILLNRNLYGATIKERPLGQSARANGALPRTEAQIEMRDETASEQRAERLRRWKDWDEFVASKTNAGFMQSFWWADLMVSRGWEEHFGTALRDGKAIVGGAVVWIYSFTPEKCFYYIPEGPVLQESDSSAEQEHVFQTIMNFIEGKRRNEQRGVSHLRIEPRWEHIPSFVREFQQSDKYYFHLPRDTLCNDLNVSESAILAQMKPKARYNVRLAQKCGVSIVQDVSPQGIEDFLNIYRQTCSRKDIKGLTSSWFQTLIPTLSALERGSVFFAEYQGMRIATALVVYFGRRATYLYGGSIAAHRNVMAPYLLHFKIMCKAKVLGCQCYDWYGVAPQSEPNHGWADISTFKRKFGGEELNLVRTLDYIYEPTAYREWKAIEDEDA